MALEYYRHKVLRVKLANNLEVSVLSDSREHDICQTKGEGLVDINEDLGTYCSPLTLVCGHGISQCQRKC
jgi:hypothetical protein